jgi:catechol 2,3-dioxygenase-like lactoylglutathione lyase family enzyme
MIQVQDYNHIGIVVRKLEKCQWFYGTLLGLQTIARPPFNFPGHWYQVGPKTQLHLMVYDETIPQTMRHIALEVKNFLQTVQHLKENGISIVEGPGKRYDGSDFLFCNDPDGNLVEITHHGKT